jgi:hemerythrin-like metal-binding protein/diguanylate cyclase (GGDEF)-like protein
MSAGIRDVVGAEASATSDPVADSGATGAHPERALPPLVVDVPSVVGRAALLVLEIDRWRLIHELLGPMAAEVVSRHLAQCVRAALRDGDRCFRIGPGQYVTLMPDAGYETAESLAAVVSRALESKAFADVGPVTLSGAVAERFPAESVGQWWKRLDSTLAQAKGGGGNRVVVDRRHSEHDAGEHGPGLHLEWQPRFECGEPTIDRQHRELFRRAEEVLDAARRNDPLVTPVQQLVAGIARHFQTEEAILAKYGYCELPQHARTHAVLLEKARRMQLAVAAERATREDLLRFLLADVVADHMLSEDRLFARLFANRGAES